MVFMILLFICDDICLVAHFSCLDTFLSNHPVGALFGIARPVVNSVGLSFKMAPEGVLEFTCLVKVSIYCNILF